MITNAKSMACGNCGHGLFRMFSGERAGAGFKTLFAECNQCKSVSTFEPTPPVLNIGWGPGARGILCQMEPNPT